MPDMTGIDLLRKLKELSPQTVSIVITAYASVENAVEAMRLGALNYLIKPFSPDTIEAIIEKATEHVTLVTENSYLRQENSSTQQIVAESPAMKQILSDIAKVAKSNASIFIHGESGTGKEVIAQAIHQHSLRLNRPFIKVNCAAIAESLAESEFFGHEKGSFTGANSKRIGRFELANQGTLLLDEITEVPIGMQAKLLRAVQEQEFERVGGNKPVKVDVRIISTSNRDMDEAIAEKKIREDLYYRLNVFPIHLPPLRERREEIVPLANHFIEKFCQENKKEKMSLSEGAKKKLLAYPWPGNVRELANIIERVVVLDLSKIVEKDHIHLETGGKMVGATLGDLEKKFIIETLHSAEKLGISLDILRNKLLEMSNSETAC
jgi:two-component system, NtrC family, response regulator AtoC